MSPWGLNCVAFEKTDNRCVTVEKTQKSFETVEKTRGILAEVQEKLVKGALRSKKRTPESAPGRPKPFRAKVEYSNQLKSYETSKAFFPAFLASPGSRMRSL